MMETEGKITVEKGSEIKISRRGGEGLILHEIIVI